jgi:MoaA/NifB/PqqE/SkfB family radical SAM enzyme
MAITPPSVTTVLDRELGQRLLAKLAGGRYPLACQWELTCLCNLRCVMCYTDCFNSPEQVRQELSYLEIVRIMDELHEAGCLELCLTGGEPLARRDFLEIYSHAKEKGFLVTVFTNGTLITDMIADVWSQLPPSMIEISLHGQSKASFETITQGPGSYDRCLAGVRLILDRGLPLTLKTTGLTLNHGEILAIKEFVRRLGTEYGTTVQYRFGSDLRHRLDGSDDVAKYQLSAELIQAVEEADPDLCLERTRHNRREDELVRLGKSLCGGGFHRFHIDAYGRLHLCSSNRRDGYDLRRGSFVEGFYAALPQFPCPNRQAAQSQELVTIQPVARPSMSREVATHG